MKKTTPCLVLVLLAYVGPQVLACAGNGRASVDARPGLDAPSCSTGLCLVDAGAAERGEPDVSPGDRCADPDDACLYSGGVLAVGQSGVDGCSTYSCEAGGKLTCTARACPGVDAGAPAECSLPTWLAFGYYGGFEGASRITLDTSGTLTVTSDAGSCLSELPACGTPCAITLETIARDLADPEVQAALAATSGSVHGISLISQDVADFLVTLGDGRSIEVGVPCCRFPDLPCQPIPNGVQRLVNDLKTVMAGITVCTPT